MHSDLLSCRQHSNRRAKQEASAQAIEKQEVLDTVIHGTAPVMPENSAYRTEFHSCREKIFPLIPRSSDWRKSGRAQMANAPDVS